MKDKYGRTALMYSNEDPLVKLLVENGADIIEAERLGFTDLMNAALRGYAEVVTNLLRNGADVNETDNEGHTALMFSAQLGQTEVVTVLLNKDKLSICCNFFGYISH